MFISPFRTDLSNHVSVTLITAGLDLDTNNVSSDIK